MSRIWAGQRGRKRSLVWKVKKSLGCHYHDHCRIPFKKKMKPGCQVSLQLSVWLFVSISVSASEGARFSPTWSPIFTHASLCSTLYLKGDHLTQQYSASWFLVLNPWLQAEEQYGHPGVCLFTVLFKVGYSWIMMHPCMVSCSRLFKADRPCLQMRLENLQGWEGFFEGRHL